MCVHSVVSVCAGCGGDDGGGVRGRWCVCVCGVGPGSIINANHRVSICEAVKNFRR